MSGPRSLPPGGATIDVAPEISKAIEEIRLDSSETRWLLAHFEDGNTKKSLTPLATGSGDVDELADLLEYDQAGFGFYRTTDLIDDITTVKFVYIVWLGEDIKPMAKAKLSVVAGAVEKIFNPVHVTVTCFNNSDKDDLVQLVKDKVSASSGSKSFVK